MPPNNYIIQREYDDILTDNDFNYGDTQLFRCNIMYTHKTIRFVFE